LIDREGPSRTGGEGREEMVKLLAACRWLLAIESTVLVVDVWAY
jgi:hypothetical protein